MGKNCLIVIILQIVYIIIILHYEIMIMTGEI